MILIERGLGIMLMLLFTALGFGWGWIIRSIQEKDKKGGEK